MNHLIGSLEYFRARGEGRQTAAMATAAAWRRPGALEQTIDTGAGEIPGTAFATMALSEMLTHGWDLAKATGQRMPPDDVEADEILAGMKQTLKPDARKPAFGPEVQAPSGAPPIDRLAAFLGRHP